MLNKLIAIVHLITGFLYSFYAFIFPKNLLYDYIYYVFLSIIQLSWIIFNHECPFSCFYKTIYYKNYKCGDTTDLDDFIEIAPKSDKSENSINYSKIVDLIFSIGLILSTIIVGYRSNLSNMYIALFVLIFMRFFYIFFNNAIGINSKRIVKSVFGKKVYKFMRNIYYNFNIVKIHNDINNIIFIILILFIFYITYRNKQRL